MCRRKKPEYEDTSCIYCGGVYRRYFNAYGNGEAYPINCPFCGLAYVKVRSANPKEWNSEGNGKRVFPTPPIGYGALGTKPMNYADYSTYTGIGYTLAPQGRSGLHVIIEPNNNKRPINNKKRFR